MKKLTYLTILSLFFSFPLSPTTQAQGFLERKVVKIGQAVPDFDLKDTAGNPVKLSDFKGKVVMIHFWSAKCPFVVRYEERLQKITSEYQGKGVIVLGIDSNENDPLDEIKKVSAERHVNYPILIDPGNKIADVFGAVTTPHVYIVDQAGILRYEGAVDDQGWSADNPVTKNYARDALDSILSGSAVVFTETKTFGCTVKRKI